MWLYCDYVCLQLVFEANVGTRTDGMIALDDIVSQDSLCTSKFTRLPTLSLLDMILYSLSIK